MSPDSAIVARESSTTPLSRSWRSPPRGRCLDNATRRTLAAVELLGMTWSGWLLWSAILVGITTRCLNMWAYGPSATMARFRHDRRPFRVLMPTCGLVIGALAWSWGAYGTAAANLVLAAMALQPDVVRRQRWLARALGSPPGM